MFRIIPIRVKWMPTKIKTKTLILNLLDGKTLPSLVKTLYESLGQDYAIEFYSLTLMGEESQLPATKARP